ncbi:MAG TPA: TetR/AcrR family transcriptional regulator [Saprospiraceae bacterium]|mgnify:CR=1 FL=1|nr:TetR/AcrR family transcriptional regulator [Saprospiraceae bacterium]HMQ84198.1 TetR/AcrR family transcriptional regulator [Saprospiraceae bacterium]
MEAEERILVAAKKVFTEKGYAAARMQEIADTAGINKGLLHYYFRSKEKLFMAIFDEAFDKFTLKINRIFEMDKPLFEKIEVLVHEYIDMMMENPALPGFVLYELNQKGESFVKDIMAREGKPNPLPLIGQIQMEIDAGRLRADINPFQLVLNILSMCVFPFVARPLFQGIIQADDRFYMQIMENRKSAIVAFAINAIRPG